MLNNYLQISSSLDEYSCSVLFIQPYAEAKNNFKVCSSDGLSLTGRIAHLAAGVLLFVPLLNTITLLFLRLFSYQPERELLDPQPLPTTEKASSLQSVDGSTTCESIQASIILPTDGKTCLLTDFLAFQASPAAASARNQRILRDCVFEPPAVPKPPSLLPDPKIPRTDQEFIEKFVDQFLWPYIQGKVAAENEPPNRVSMMELLKNALVENGRTGLSDQEIEKIALAEYLYRSCLGLYIHLKTIGEIESTTPEFDVLIRALTKSLPKDFPDTEWEAAEISEKAKQALIETNQKRKESFLQALNHPIAGRKKGDIGG
ncbi:MAG TPA: hypothetical protein VHL30_03035 [Chlamydiales bacterium]|nr:hypothetical protein [Chlamydiales bacterium]